MGRDIVRGIVSMICGDERGIGRDGQVERSREIKMRKGDGYAWSVCRDYISIQKEVW